MILGGRPSKASPVGPSGSSTRTVRCVSEVREGRVEAFFGVFVVRSGLFIFWWPWTAVVVAARTTSCYSSPS